MYTYAGGSGPVSDDPTDEFTTAGILVTKTDGLPDPQNAGNVLGLIPPLSSPCFAADYDA